MLVSYGKMGTSTATGNGISIIFLGSHSVTCTTALSHLNSSTLNFHFGNPSQRHKNSTTKRFNAEMKQLLERKQPKCRTKE